jgi:hypothetical protein
MPLSGEEVVAEIKAFLEQSNLKYMNDKQGDVHRVTIVFGFTAPDGRHARKIYQIQVRPEQQLVTIYGTPDWNVPPQTRNAAALFVTLVNQDLVQGTMDLDPSDGDTRFRTNFFYGNATTVAAALRSHYEVMETAYSRFFPAYEQVALGRKGAEEAFREAKASSAPSAQQAAMLRLLLELARASGGGGSGSSS